MCDGIRIEDYPFIEAMVFANLVVDDNGMVMAPGTNVTAGEKEPSVSAGVGRRFGGIELQLLVAVACFGVLFSSPWAGPGFLGC